MIRNMQYKRLNIKIVAIKTHENNCTDGSHTHKYGAWLFFFSNIEKSWGAVLGIV
jgi:hypothetical protein